MGMAQKQKGRIGAAENFKGNAPAEAAMDGKMRNRQGVKEKRFFETLKDIFIGVPIEGESGYINLMRIKAKYFERVMVPNLQTYVDQALKPFPEFREELFDKLYTFFKRYFTESGSIGFFFTPYHQSVYEQVYTGERDVVLFWKTARLYYVKTDRLFRSMKVEVDGFHFFFDVSTLEHKKANEKRSLVFDFKERQGDGTLVFTVQYSERGRQTNIGEIRRAIKDALGLSRYTDAVPSEETLERAFRLFERQSEVDYFICKDAKSFLREQFDLWMWQYLLGKPGEEPQTEWTETRLRQLQALKRIAYRVIDFIAAFEDELVKIWNKPKFVLRSNYVITLDKIYDRKPELLERLTQHPRFAEQVKEWQDLGMVDEAFTPKALWENDLIGKHLNPRYRFLPIDTRYFKDLELEILSLFDNLDEALDGWLIKSENYQALNTILPKFRERVRVVYIDPPYNTGTDEFIYRDRYQRSSWLSMLFDRLKLAKEWMSNLGAIFVSVDDNQHDSLWFIMKSVFGEENAITSMVWEGGLKNDSRFISVSQDYIVVFVKDKEFLAKQDIRWRVRKEGIDEIYAQVERLKLQFGSDYARISRGLKEWYSSLPRGHPAKQHRHYNMVDERGVFFPGDISWPGGGGPMYEVYHPVTGKPVRKPQRGWVFPTEERMQEAIREGKVLFGPDENSVPKLKRYLHETEGQVLWPVFYKDRRAAFQQLRDILGADVYANPKDPETIEKLIEAAGDTGCFVLDFFAGSGTTAHAVINLNRRDSGRRKYILVEMADYFYTVLLPRIKKVVFSDKWRDGKAQPDGQGISHFVKYYELEQYEDTLRRTRYLDDDLFTPPPTEDPCQYLFLRDPKMTEALELELDLERGTVKVDLSKLYEDIDLAETLSCITGKWIKRILPDPEDPTKPGTVEFADGTTADLKNPDWQLIKPLIWW